ncbi:PREDICTED: ras-related protein Rab-37-like [Priapulus caudatus]|uniref:Ras-related protein Rab-37-like n=1 Tax=Priapulus caudatus TaxID=37621 RepID=A0ABM1EE50_PRICU|nr:PREDICTED: ras-related protein Rab-37-like [Priapulus caudatus]
MVVYTSLQPHADALPPRHGTHATSRLYVMTILVGDSGVGKTSFLVQFEQGKFTAGSFSATVGIGFTNLALHCAMLTQLNKIDLITVTRSGIRQGQERFRSVTHAYYRDAHALLLLYDVTNRHSFDNIRAWLSEINEYAQEDVVIMLIGNKCDVTSERLIRKEDGEKLARDHGVPFMETSAKSGVNVDLAFMAVARDLKSRKTRRPNEPKFNVTEYVNSEKKQTSTCCS